jgi:hypothetical protein
MPRWYSRSILKPDPTKMPRASSGARINSIGDVPRRCGVCGWVF